MTQPWLDPGAPSGCNAPMSLVSSLAYRARWASLGVYYVRTLKLRTVRIGRKSVKLSLPEGERHMQETEFGRILFDDCYDLRSIHHPVRTVLDVGANVGLFALAARRHFPRAAIHCYEPNAEVGSHLRRHCDAVDAVVHMEAVGASAGTVSLTETDQTVHRATKTGGSIRQIAFAEAIARLGGTVDFLKLDCEGAEWDIFRDQTSWSRVRSVAMEYHPFAKPGSDGREVEAILRKLAFSSVRVIDHGTYGFAFASRS